MIYKIIAFSFYFFVGLSSIIVGIIYITAKKYTYYHAQATGKKWEDVDEIYKPIILALLKFVGAGFITAGLSMIGAIEIFYNHITGPYLSTITGLFFWISSFIVTSWVKYKTGAKTPVLPSLINVILISIGFILYLLINK